MFVYEYQLLSVSPALNSLVEKLRHDADIQSCIQGISARAGDAASAFRSTMEVEGGKVFAQKSALMKTLSPNDVQITDMKSSLNAAIKALQSNRTLVISLQTEIHISVESCRGRRMEHDNNLSTMRIRISNLNDEIKSLDENIKVHDDEAATSERSAAELEERRNSIQRANKRRKRRAGIGGIVGVALAPFTGHYIIYYKPLYYHCIFPLLTLTLPCP